MMMWNNAMPKNYEHRNPHEQGTDMFELAVHSFQAETQKYIFHSILKDFLEAVRIGLIKLNYFEMLDDWNKEAAVLLLMRNGGGFE